MRLQLVNQFTTREASLIRCFETTPPATAQSSHHFSRNTLMSCGRAWQNWRLAVNMTSMNTWENMGTSKQIKCICVNIYIYTYTEIIYYTPSLSIYIYTYIWISPLYLTYADTYLHIHIYIHTYIYIYTCIHMCIHL